MVTPLQIRYDNSQKRSEAAHLEVTETLNADAKCPNRFGHFLESLLDKSCHRYYRVLDQPPARHGRSSVGRGSDFHFQTQASQKPGEYFVPLDMMDSLDLFLARRSKLPCHRFGILES